MEERGKGIGGGKERKGKRKREREWCADICDRLNVHLADDGTVKKVDFK